MYVIVDSVLLDHQCGWPLGHEGNKRINTRRHRSLELKLQWLGGDLDLASEKLCGDPISLFLRSCQRGLLGSIAFLVLDQGWKNIQAPQWHRTLSFSSTALETFLWLFHTCLLLYGIGLQRGPASSTKYIKHFSYFSISLVSLYMNWGVYSFSTSIRISSWSWSNQILILWVLKRPDGMGFFLVSKKLFFNCLVGFQGMLHFLF